MSEHVAVYITKKTAVIYTVVVLIVRLLVVIKYSRNVILLPPLPRPLGLRGLLWVDLYLLRVHKIFLIDSFFRVLAVRSCFIRVSTNLNPFFRQLSYLRGIRRKRFTHNTAEHL
jgi:hypothetical protein